MTKPIVKKFVEKIDEQLDHEMMSYIEYVTNNKTQYRVDLQSMEERISHLIVIHEAIWSML